MRIVRGSHDQKPIVKHHFHSRQEVNDITEKIRQAMKRGLIFKSPWGAKVERGHLLAKAAKQSNHNIMNTEKLLISSTQRRDLPIPNGKRESLQR